jgi:hypothetical protein
MEGISGHRPEIRRHCWAGLTPDFDSNGNVTVEPCSDDGFADTHDCLDQPETAQQAEADCLNGSYNGGQPGEWHPDTDICSL